MAKSFSKLMEKLSPDSKRRSHEAFVEMLQDYPWAALRVRRGALQTELAELLGVSQAAVSKMEGRGDIRLSTLGRFVKALGGRLQLQVKFANETCAIDESEEGIGFRVTSYTPNVEESGWLPQTFGVRQPFLRSVGATRYASNDVINIDYDVAA